VRPGEPGDRIDKKDHALAGFDQALRALDAEVGDADVVLDLLVI